MSKVTSMTTEEIRESFQKFFESKKHTRVESARLIPEKDPTLLFVNAGMVPFKDCFLGLDKRDYTRATSAQKCVRAGGKHNDLENVGFTARHHTFFEMLGNFSFGDYFKREAIAFAWEYVTEVLKLPKDKLAVSVYNDDDEAAEIWAKEMGVPEDRIFRFGEADNFWSMGDTGPCGPCSEIFWDQGKEVDGDRWLEFWNCVFMQFDRQADGTLVPLKKPSVDTGMGLERMAAILQGVESNYEIDLMAELIQATKTYCEIKTSQKVDDGEGTFARSALRVIVDHLRATSFLIADGVLPSNEGRGYVLRRILRRAVRFGKQLGLPGPFLWELYPELQAAMGVAYPELNERESVVIDVLRQEEEKFFETLEKGLGLLENAFTQSKNKLLAADVAFQLYDTFGFPLDLTELIAREKGFKVDTEGFEKLLSSQQERSRAAWKGSGAQQMPTQVREWKAKGLSNEFLGYKSSRVDEAKVLAVFHVNEVSWTLLDQCPFYGEGGGQVGDQGYLEFDGVKLRVEDSQKAYEGAWVLQVNDSKTQIKEGLKLRAVVDEQRRSQVKANHTGTHLLHAALRRSLGDHVAQAGSVVDENRLRFDFSHPKSVSTEQLKKIEEEVNENIAKNISLVIENKSIEEAKKQGAMALFGEKYGDVVRVVDIPGASTELCGGLHVSSTGEIGQLKILSEAGVAAGTRRIEAITGAAVKQYYKDQEEILEDVARKLKVPADGVAKRIEQVLEQLKNFEKEVERLKGQIARGDSGAKAIEVQFKGAPLKIHVLADADPKILRQKSDHLRQSEASFAHLLIAEPHLMVTVDPHTLKGFHAGSFLKELVAQFGGKGGGQDKSAQGQLQLPQGGVDELVKWVKSQ
ncbi:alanine--tRNA ligase [bacterium]|nr:alanine--tRNA ligase [bacterium]